MLNEPTCLNHKHLLRKLLLDISNKPQLVKYDSDRDIYFAEEKFSPTLFDNEVTLTTKDPNVLSVKPLYHKGTGEIYFRVERKDNTIAVRDFKLVTLSFNLVTNVAVRELFYYQG